MASKTEVKPVPTSLPLSVLSESTTNPRGRTHDPAAHEELVASVTRLGVLQPILVRPKGKGYEVVCGHRRFRAAKAVKLEAIPAVVRELNDTEVLEIQIVENLQRSDLHPLDEAAGYQRLVTSAKYDAAKIANSIGRSVKYVYDRLGLLGLTSSSQALFRSGTITASHAIILSRLSEADQDRVTKDGLLEYDRGLFDPAVDGSEPPRKACSTRELQAWVDKHVRFDPKAVDPMIFPETAMTLTNAQQSDLKIVPITSDHYVVPDAREGRTYGPRSWVRADKPCDHAVLGVVAVGAGRGTSFPVCIAKDKCKVHWGAEIKAKAKAAKQAANSVPTKGEEQRQREDEKRRQVEEKRKAERAAWQAKAPALLAALAQAVQAVTLTDKVTAVLVERCTGYRAKKNALDAVPRGSTPEQLVRHLLYRVFADVAADEWNAPTDFPAIAKLVGIDLKAVFAPEAKVKAPAPAKTPRTKAAKAKS